MAVDVVVVVLEHELDEVERFVDSVALNDSVAGHRLPFSVPMVVA